jgi:hypothetical protein
MYGSIFDVFVRIHASAATSDISVPVNRCAHRGHVTYSASACDFSTPVKRYTHRGHAYIALSARDVRTPANRHIHRGHAKAVLNAHSMSAPVTRFAHCDHVGVAVVFTLLTGEVVSAAVVIAVCGADSGCCCRWGN